MRASPDRVYEEALALAFDRGYQILYSNELSRLLEIERPERSSIFGDRVFHIDLFVRSASEPTRIHARVYSYDVDTPEGINVNEKDLAVMHELLDRLLERLGEAPRSPIDGGNDGDLP